MYSDERQKWNSRASREFFPGTEQFLASDETNDELSGDCFHDLFNDGRRLHGRPRGLAHHASHFHESD